MAVDTPTKRSSALFVRTRARRFLPVPDAAIDVADRAHLAAVYYEVVAAGISAWWLETNLSFSPYILILDGASATMLKNTAGQTIGSQMTAVADGSEFTGDVTVYVTPDGGTQAIGEVGGGVCVHEGSGFHSYTPSAAETNHDHVAFTFVGSGAVTKTAQAYPQVSAQSVSVVVVEDDVTTAVGFPATLNIGDSYDAENALVVYIRDANDDPVTALIGHDFTDEDFAPVFTIAPGPGDRGRVVANVSYVVPGGVAENYLKVEIPTSQSKRAVEGYSTVQCVLKWGSSVQKTLITTTVEWIQRL